MNSKREYFLGIDVGSVSTNFVIIGENDTVVDKLYIRTEGDPISAIKTGLQTILRALDENNEICGVGATGSGRQLANAIVGADVIKNEITAHAVAALKCNAQVKTVIEIGGQDSKIILLRNGIVYDFAMNTVCAAGTGSFLDRQAARLSIPIEQFGLYALQSASPVRIAGRCAVFAETDMIHKQQMGHSKEDIIRGLCEALVRNYLANLAKGKKLETPVMFQGGVAANIGIKKAFEDALNTEIIVPRYYDVMGAYGAAILAKEFIMNNSCKTKFAGRNILEEDYSARSRECSGCSNSCEIIQIVANNSPIASWGDRCGKWSSNAG